MPCWGDRPNERQSSHPGLDNPVWDQAVTSGWRDAPAQPILRCNAAVRPAVSQRKQYSHASRTSSSLIHGYICFSSKTDLLSNNCGKVSVFNFDLCGVIWSELGENRRRKTEKMFSLAASHQKMPFVTPGYDAASAFNRYFPLPNWLVVFKQTWNALKETWCYLGLLRYVFFFLRRQWHKGSEAAGNGLTHHRRVIVYLRFKRPCTPDENTW